MLFKNIFLYKKHNRSIFKYFFSKIFKRVDKYGYYMYK